MLSRFNSRSVALERKEGVRVFISALKIRTPGYAYGYVRFLAKLFFRAFVLRSRSGTNQGTINGVDCTVTPPVRVYVLACVICLSDGSVVSVRKKK